MGLQTVSNFIGSDFIGSEQWENETEPTYWYEGICPQTQQRLRLPRTALVEAIARGLMRQLPPAEQEGKMYGVLLVETPTGKQGVLKAFSGLLNGQSCLEGWVPAIPGRDRVQVAEALVLTQLEAMKQELIQLHALPERSHYAELIQAFQQQREQLRSQHEQQQRIRAQQRQHDQQTLTGDALVQALERLNRQSQLEGIVWRNLKRSHQAQLQPLQAAIAHADAQMQAIKRDRKALSRQLQHQLHTAYWLTNFAGESRSLQELGLTFPTGTGDCCAPKLLHYAATHALKPLAMAEFWWGVASPQGDKQQGQFYGACRDRCQPIMGFLLSGLSPAPTALDAIQSPPILYEDDWLMAVDKPAGLLSVPGRHSHRQDSVLSRLRAVRSEGMTLTAVHRLDQDTSGVLLIARHEAALKSLRKQFEQHRVQKQYEAILWGSHVPAQGVIDLPLWGNPDDRPYQTVDWQRGKPSITHYQVLEQTTETTRIRLIPLTGRTHQLRVHAAHPYGLGRPIIGDRLYGSAAATTRLHLHARELICQHPQSGQTLQIKSDTPF